jgi:hypothetical protein
VFEHIYAEGSPLVDAQREWHANYRASFEAAGER